MVFLILSCNYHQVWKSIQILHLVLSQSINHSLFPRNTFHDVIVMYVKTGPTTTNKVIYSSTHHTKVVTNDSVLPPSYIRETHVLIYNIIYIRIDYFVKYRPTLLTLNMQRSKLSSLFVLFADVI